MKSKLKTHPGRELRGYRFRLYTTETQDMVLRDYTEKLKHCWNWLCSRARDVAQAREAYAERYGGVVRPAKEASASEWRAYRKAVLESCARVAVTREQYAEHCGLQPPPKEVSKEAKAAYRAAVQQACAGVDIDPVSYRSLEDWQGHFGVRHDYQIFSRACGVDLPARLLQALCKDYQAALQATTRGQAPPRHKRQHDHVTLRTRSGKCMRLRAVGPRPKSQGRSVGRTDWLNCEVRLPGIGWIAGHIGNAQLPRLEAPEYWAEGVSVVEEPDGWYAAIRQWVVPRSPSNAPSALSRWLGYGMHGVSSPVSRGDVLGIDTGLVHLVTIAGQQDALASGNTRTHELLERIAGRQSAELPVSKLQCQAARRVRHLLRGVEAWIREAQPSAIAIEDGSQQDDTDAGPAASISLYVAQEGRGRKRREGGYVPGAGWLLSRLSDLTREVSRRDSTRTCSRCGNDEDYSLNSAHRTYHCHRCELTLDRDANAARNLRSRYMKSLGSSADDSHLQHGSA